jgi:hypothetical protein
MTADMGKRVTPRMVSRICGKQVGLVSAATYVGTAVATDILPDHDQAQGEAPGALEQRDDLELAIGGGLGEDMGRTQELTWPRWSLCKEPTRLLFFAAITPGLAWADRRCAAP